MLTGLVVGLGGNLAIKRIGYRSVSSNVEGADLHGCTGKVLVPFEGGEKGKILLIAKGHRMQLVARAFEDVPETFERGEEVVVVRMNGAVAEVLRPD